MNSSKPHREREAIRRSLNSIQSIEAFGWGVSQGALVIMGMLPCSVPPRNLSPSQRHHTPDETAHLNSVLLLMLQRLVSAALCAGCGSRRTRHQLDEMRQPQSWKTALSQISPSVIIKVPVHKVYLLTGEQQTGSCEAHDVVCLKSRHKYGLSRQMFLVCYVLRCKRPFHHV